MFVLRRHVLDRDKAELRSESSDEDQARDDKPIYDERGNEILDPIREYRIASPGPSLYHLML